MWLANAVTLSRIPIAAVFWLTYGQNRWLSLGLVALAALTDAADGNLARYAKRRTGSQSQGPALPDRAAPPKAVRSQSTVGEWLDPAADKLFIIGVLGAIQVHDPVPWGIVALIVARELVVIPLATIYRFVVHGRGKHAFQAGLVGKAATIAEFFAIAAIIVYSPAVVPLAIAAAALGLTAVALYIVRATHTPPRLAT